MSFSPGFIADFHDEIGDPDINKKLRSLAFEFNKKDEQFEKNKRTQSDWKKFDDKHFGNKGKGTDFETMQRHLRNEYKLKVQEIAKPHVEPEKFEELAQKHQPEYTEEEILAMEAERQKDTISLSQERATELLNQHAKREAEQKSTVTLDIDRADKPGIEVEIAKQPINQQQTDTSQLSEKERYKQQLLKMLENKTMTQQWEP